jgi:2-dehydropantoate 2-reductase
MGTPVSGVLHIGRVPAEPVGPDNKLLPQISGDLTAACFRIHCPDDVMAWKYRKLISNLGNIFEALVGPSKELQHLREAAEREARAVLDAADIAYTSDDEESTARAGAFPYARGRGSRASLRVHVAVADPRGLGTSKRTT